MTNQTKALPVDEYWRMLETQLPRPMSPEEQHAAVVLYRELAKGKRIDAEQLARALGASLAETLALLESDAIKAFVFPDNEGRIVGFGGLATAPMHHRFEVDGRILWTWCAWDSLFIPEILGCDARVVSRDPHTKEVVRLVVAPERIKSAAPKHAVVSFTHLDAEALRSSAVNIMAGFCHFIFFFSSEASAQRWLARHPGTFLYSLDEAFSLAKRLNARNFGTELAKTRASVPKLRA